MTDNQPLPDPTRGRLSTPPHSNNGDERTAPPSSPKVLLNRTAIHCRLMSICAGERYHVQDLTTFLAGGSEAQLRHVQYKVIPDLVKKGILRIVAGRGRHQVVERTDEIVRFKVEKGLPLGEASPYRDIVTVKPVCSTLQEDPPFLNAQISPELLLMILRDDPGLRDAPAVSGQPFGISGQDPVRLVAALATGIASGKVRAWWNPELSIYRVQTIFKQYTGSLVGEFAKGLHAECLDTVIERMTKHLCDTARAIAARWDPDRTIEASNADALLLCHLASDSPSAENLRKGGAAFGIPASELPEFARIVFNESRAMLASLLREKPTDRILLTEAEGVAVRMRLIERATLSEIGKAIGRTGERARQHLDRVGSLHPLFAEILDVRDHMGLNSGASAEAFSELIQQIRGNPGAAFAEGNDADPSPTPFPHETPEQFRRRLVFAAFAGKYLSLKNSPRALRIVSSQPKRFFRKLVYELMNDSMRRAMAEYQLSATEEQVRELLPPRHLGRSAFFYNLLKITVSNPQESQIKLFTRCAEGTPIDIAYYRGLFNSIEPLAREEGRRRARAACRVWDEPWCQAWLPRNPSIHGLLRHRIIEQGSFGDALQQIRATALAAGARTKIGDPLRRWTLFSIHRDWKWLVTQFPPIKELAPLQRRRPKRG